MNNGYVSPPQNTLRGAVLPGALGNSLTSAQQLNIDAQQAAILRQYNEAVTGSGRSMRLNVEVEFASNGFVLTMGRERLIAKDIEELQQHFVAHVAAVLLDKSK